jgi:hypothetical protein
MFGITAQMLISGQRLRSFLGQAELAVGESVIRCPSPLNVLKDAYDHSCY